MEKVLAPRGTQLSLETLVSDIQTYAQLNYNRLIDFVFERYGVNAKVTPTGEISSEDTYLKVTSSGPNDLGIEPGDAITSGLQYLSVSSRISIAQAERPTSGTHGLYLMHAVAGDTPEDITNGGFYNPGARTINTREHDSYIAAWDSPGVSGVWLANVTLSGGLVQSITDTRKSNVLKYSPKIIDSLTARLSETDSQTFRGQIQMPSFVMYSGLESILVTYDNMYDLVNPNPPPIPKNFRIANVYSPTELGIPRKESVNLAESVRTGLMSSDAKVLLKWNWDDIQGGGNSVYTSLNANQFRIINSMGSKVWATNELAGYYFWDTVNAKNYYIIENTATIADITDLTVSQYQHTSAIKDVVLTGNQFGWIHCNATSYEIVATPISDSGAEDVVNRIETKIYSESGAVLQTKALNLLLGVQYTLKIKSIGKFRSSSYVTMLAGSYSKLPPFLTVNSYESPYTVKIPIIDSDGANIGAVATYGGFIVNINGWEAATDFEICYSTDASGADFTNPTHGNLITSKRSVQIPAANVFEHSIKVRPLISGQSVATALSTTVTPGLGNAETGYTPNPVEISFKSYAGKVGNFENKFWTLSEIYSPAEPTANYPDYAMSLTGADSGDVITISGVDYVINSVNDGGRVILTKDGTRVTDAVALTGLTFTSGISKLSRELQRIKGFNTDTEVKKVYVEIFSRNTFIDEPAPVLRWYQVGYEQYADSIVLGHTSDVYTKDTDVKIVATQGERELVLELWDQTESDNISGFRGRVVVWTRPYTAPATPADTFAVNTNRRFTKGGE